MIFLWKHRLAAALAWLLCAAMYFSTASGTAREYLDRKNGWHHYEYLVDGFLRGQLSLSLEPPPELLRLSNPYDPEKNEPFRLWDATLYHGKYYLYYGPVPALVLMLPWRVVTGFHLPQWAAIAVFASLGLAALTFLLTEIREKYFGATTPARLFAAVLLTAHLSWLPVVARRGAFWELPIVTAIALFWIGLYFLWRYFATDGRPRWVWPGAVAFALMPGARPTFAVAAVVLTSFLLTSPGHKPLLGRTTFRRWPRLIPLAVSGVALIGYNYNRFGSVLEFGQSYQLWGAEFRGLALFSAAYLPFNLSFYFFTPPNFSPYFPFIHPLSLGETSDGYLGTQDMVGALLVMPALLLILLTWRFCWVHRSETSYRPMRLLVLAAAVGGTLVAGFLLCFGGNSCSRYIAEVLTGWTPLAAIGFIVLLAMAPAHRMYRLARWLGVVAALWTMVATQLASFEFRGIARTTQPNVYRALAHFSNYPSLWVARYRNQRFGPVTLEVRLAGKPAPGSSVLLAAGQTSALSQLMLERLADGNVKLRLIVNGMIVVETPALAAAASTMRIRCEVPWLYPPAAHPYWDALSKEETRRRQTLFSLEINGVTYARHANLGFDALHFDPAVRTTSDACAWVEQWSWADVPASH